MRGKVGTQEHDINWDKTSSSWWKTLPFPIENASVFEVRRPKGFRFNNFSYNIAADILGRNILVTGEGHTKEQAVTKAVAELIERSALIEVADADPSVKTSNGWAAHSDFEVAKLNAIRELVERDTILKHWYSMTPFAVVDSSSLPDSFKSWIGTE
ncbi:MAG TPA: YcaO-like family protein, partial [Pseudobdellovibrionaceae bacterium]|nr:YcaO-like family protein [Pseudobdellovibrionaceae bacterium]